MLPGERFYGDPDRLFAIADPAHELGREEGHALAAIGPSKEMVLAPKRHGPDGARL